MGYPIPLVTETTAARVLGTLYLNTRRAHPDQGAAEPVLLLTLPPAWANKYQILLYGAAARHGYAVAGVTTHDDLDHVIWPGPVLLHTHWFAALFHGAANTGEAMQKLSEIRAAITRFRDRTGARIMWTAHNIFPHGNAFPEVFLALRQWIFEEFDAIHLMDDAHLPLLEQAFDRPAPEHFIVPHMLYTGSLPDTIDSATARAHFGLSPETTVFGYFGSIQAYKGIPALIDALDQLGSDRPVHALIGGLPVDTEAVRMIQNQVGTRRDITLMARKIQDHEIQYLHHAADAMVLPYDETLNSGAAMMAASFRRPVLLPEGSMSRALAPLGGRSFDRDDPASMVAAMAAITATPRTEPQIDEAAWQARQPDRISEAFFTALTALMNR